MNSENWCTMVKADSVYELPSINIKSRDNQIKGVALIITQKKTIDIKTSDICILRYQQNILFLLFAPSPINDVFCEKLRFFCDFQENELQQVNTSGKYSDQTGLKH